MASFLGEYSGRASNPDKKFIRAVKSFLSQTYENCELIIVADGCDKTEKIYNENFKDIKKIRFIKIDKQPVYGAEIRNAGIEIADGEIISYLDNDDALGKKHLELVMSEWNDDVDMMYYDDFLVMSSDFKKLHQRTVETRYGSIGTSSFTHRNVDYLRWSEGYGHDWVFLMSAIVRGMRFKKLSKPSQYLVAHWGGGDKKGDF